MTVTPAMRAWANAIAARYGHPVWLVGSALVQEEPRDVDVVVMLPWEDFEARYGDSGLWCRATYEGDDTAGAYRRWAADVGKLSSKGSVELRLNLDFKVQGPQSWWPEKDRPRVRLDVVDELPLPVWP